MPPTGDERNYLIITLLLLLYFSHSGPCPWSLPAGWQLKAAVYDGGGRVGVVAERHDLWLASQVLDDFGLHVKRGGGEAGQ